MHGVEVVPLAAPDEALGLKDVRLVEDGAAKYTETGQKKARRVGV